MNHRLPIQTHLSWHPPTGFVRLTHSRQIIIWCPPWFHWQKGKKKSALARNPTQRSFQPSSDCLIGIHCCVCQECWQNLRLICIKQEEAEISLLFCVLLPLLHPLEKNQHDILWRREREALAALVQPCTIDSMLPLACFDTSFSSLFDSTQTNPALSRPDLFCLSYPCGEST